MFLCVFMRRQHHLRQINVLCTIYEKEHIFKLKIKSAAPSCFFPYPYIGNLTQSKQNVLVWPKFSNCIRRGPLREVSMGCQKVDILLKGLSEIYFFCYNLFLYFLYYRRRNDRLKTVVSMLSYGAVERSNNPYIESIFEPCVFKNQKEIFAMWV